VEASWRGAVPFYGRAKPRAELHLLRSFWIAVITNATRAPTEPRII